MKDFTSWDVFLRPDKLEHHGIKNMKWGVRRYQYEDGTLTALGKERYGVNGTGRSPRKMARDFNNLDKGYANVAAQHRENVGKVIKYSTKATRARAKGRADKAEKMRGKSLKYAKDAALNNQQKKAIEALQWKIIGNAAKKGYTTTSTPVKRIGTTGKQRAIAAIPSMIMGGGVLAGAAGGAYLAKKGLKVDGQQVRIRKHGSGGTSITNYANTNKYAEEERKRRRQQQAAQYYRG